MFAKNIHPGITALALINGATAYRCETCGCGVASDHEPASTECYVLIGERLRKAVQ